MTPREQSEMNELRRVAELAYTMAPALLHGEIEHARDCARKIIGLHKDGTYKNAQDVEP